MTFKQRWMLDRRISLAVMLTFVMQAVGAVVWAARLDARVDSVEKQQQLISALNERFIRMEERMENVKRDTAAISRQLERIDERLAKK